MTTIAFDVYGTLIDPLAIGTALGEHVGERAPAFAAAWRDRQLEYSFRRGLMGVYEDFSECTRRALEHTCRATGLDLPEDVRGALLARYRALPAFDDVAPALARLRDGGHAMYAFSNGLPSDLDALLAHAGLRDTLDGVVSVHDVRSFKPDPAVYRHFEAVTGTGADEVWLVSSNPFDVIGARAVRWRAAWVRRREDAVFDPWEFAPSVTVATLDGVVDALT